MKKIKVLLVDDHTIVRNGIRSLFDDLEDIEVIDEASDGVEALEKVKLLSPDILLIDIAMPRMTGLQATAVVSKSYPQTKSLILSMHDDEDYILKAVEVGASGYLLKDSSKDEVLRAIRTVAGGDRYFNSSVSKAIVNAYLQKIRKTDTVGKEEMIKLSKKEKGVLKLIVEGMNSRIIAEKLDLSIRTIDNHRANMMRKLGVKNAAELVKLAIERKLV